MRLSLILLCACTTVRAAQRPASPQEADELNRVIGHQEHQVTTASRTVAALGVRIDMATMSWTDPSTRQRRTVPAAALQRIELRRQRGLGALEGAGIGLLVGAAAGFALGLAAGDDQCPPSKPQDWFGGCFIRFTAVQKGEFIGTGLGIAGLSVGMLIGAAVGHVTTIEFR